MLLTNAQRGDLIDALAWAIEILDSMIDSNLPPSRRNWTKDDKDDFEEWNECRKRYRKLRRAYLAEEKRA